MPVGTLPSSHPGLACVHTLDFQNHTATSYKKLVRRGQKGVDPPRRSRFTLPAYSRHLLESRRKREEDPPERDAEPSR
jgi:hypothetical protein